MVEKEGEQIFILLHVDRYNAFIIPELFSLLNATHKKYTVHKTVIDEKIKYSIVTASLSTIDYVLKKSILVSRAIVLLNYSMIDTASQECNEMSIEEKLNRSLTKEIFMDISNKIVGRYKIDCVCSNKPLAIKYLLDNLAISYEVDLTNPASTVCIIEEKNFCMVGVLYNESNRKKFLRFSVRDRQFIGNTSMDNEISFIICNMAGVSHKTILLDCYAGSGSILLSGALAGASVIGTDINEKQFKGREVAHTNARIKTQLPNTSIYSNFDMYNIRSRVLMIGAHDIFNRSILRNNTVDVILCDPPYGERETVKKKTSEGNEYVEGSDSYLISTVPFFGQVIEIGRNILKPKGKIGVFMPHTSGYIPKLKKIEGFTQIAQAEQYLNSLYSRTFFLLELSK
ncbi:tRNA (guanine10-N2)-methyltransferase [Nematocida sp. ERTm5]|nr:tRNA (guanine10-N2)-methyltransferase [Nematocida sp. ERTm5]